MLSLSREELAIAANWDALPDGYVEIYARTLSMPRFPGALVPAVRPDNTVVWYAVASDATSWRRLRPLLVAFAGLTITDFDGQESHIGTDTELEAMFLRDGTLRIARLIPSTETLAIANRALTRLIKLVEAMPVETKPPPMSTAAMLASFEMALATGDRTQAERLLNRLREEWRLAENNLRFAEVRLLVFFREWKHLAASEWLGDLVHLPMPKTIALGVMEALWEVYLAPFSDSPALLLEAYRKHVRNLVGPLLIQVPSDAKDFTSRLRGLEFPEIAKSVDATAPLAGLESSFHTGWRGWVERLTDIGQSAAIENARELLADDPAEKWIDGEVVKKFADELSVAFTGRSAETAREALPILLQWLQADPQYPRRLLKPLYDVVFTVLALLPDPQRSEETALADLFDALLSVGTSEREYIQITSDMTDVIPASAGVTSADWLLDIAGVVLSHNGRDEGSRGRLLNKILNALRSVAGVLQSAQRSAYQGLAVSAGWEPLPPPAIVESVNIWARLAGKAVAIYSLTENAARQAQDVVRELCPDVRVEITHDHVCSEQLKSLSRQADVFVVAWLSAKHAATDCIRQNRGDKPILFAPGRGFTSLVRTLEKHLLEQG